MRIAALTMLIRTALICLTVYYIAILAIKTAERVFIYAIDNSHGLPIVIAEEETFNDALTLNEEE